MGIKKEFVVFCFFSVFFFNHCCFGIIFIKPAKIKKFLEWHGRHNKIEFDDDEGLLWNYTSSQPDPWTLQDIYEKQNDKPSCVFSENVIRRVKQVFSKVAEKKKEQYKNTPLEKMDVNEVKVFINSVLKVRKVPWSNYSDFEYPKNIIEHLSSEKMSDDVVFRCSGIKNGYDLIKQIGNVTTSYFEEKYLRERDRNEDDDVSKEPELFLLLEKNKENGLIDVIGFPGYSQDQLYKKDEFFDAIMESAIRFSKKQTKKNQIFKLPYLIAGILTYVQWSYKFRKINVKKLIKILNKPVSDDSVFKYD